MDGLGPIQAPARITTLFISCVTEELGDVRKRLRDSLERSRYHVLAQEIFSQSDLDTLSKLDDYIRSSDVVIHIVGRSPGSIARPSAIRTYLANCEREMSGGFLSCHPELRLALGDFSGLSYTQWEALIALHRGIPLRVYQTAGALWPTRPAPEDEGLQGKHLERLRLASPPRYADAIASADDLLVKLPGDIPTRPRPLVPLWPLVGATLRLLNAQRVPHSDLGGGALYVRRRIEDDIDEFIASDRSAMVLVGQSGMGKTTLVKALVRRLGKSGNLCYYVTSGQLHVDPNAVASTMAQQILPDGTALDAPEVWSRLDTEAAHNGKTVLLIVDAVNEYVFASGGPTPAIPFLRCLNTLALALHRLRYRRVKLLFTCRPETWRQRPSELRQPDGVHVYHTRAGVRSRIDYSLSRFSVTEGRDAYTKYATHHDVRTPYDDLSTLTRHYLSDPLLLRLACEVYRSGEMPERGFDSGEVFRAYYEDQRISAGERRLIDVIVDYFFTSDGADGPGIVVQRDTIHYRELPGRAETLFADLDPDDPASPGSRLCSLGVLRQDNARFRFTYDRFAEYLLSERLLRTITTPGTETSEGTNTRQRAHSLQHRAEEAVRSNLARVKHVVVLSRVLRRTLRLLHGIVRDYPTLVRQTAHENEWGLSIVASTLSSLAMTRFGDTDGLKMLEGLFLELRNHRTFLSRLRRLRKAVSFPIVDTAHSMLMDEEYRAYRSGLSPERRLQHEAFLQDNLEWGFCSRDRRVSAPAIQYLYFLWRDPETRTELALPMTAHLINNVRPFSLFDLFVSSRRRARLLNLVVLFVLTLGDTQDTGQAADILPLTRSLFERLNLTGSRAFRSAIGSAGKTARSSGIITRRAFFVARGVAHYLIDGNASP